MISPAARARERGAARFVWRRHKAAEIRPTAG